MSQPTESLRKLIGIFDGMHDNEFSEVCLHKNALREECDKIDKKFEKLEKDNLEADIEHEQFEKVCAQIIGQEECVGITGEEMADLATAELEKRLMPEGMEWPRFEDGEPVLVGDVYISSIGIERNAADISFYPDGYKLGSAITYKYGERIKRPASKVLAADGKPLEVGETVWGIGLLQHEFEVLSLNDVNPEVGNRFNVKCFDRDENEKCWCDPNLLTHERPVLDADGVPIKIGDTVWIDGKPEYSWTVTDVSGCRVGGYCNEDGCRLDIPSKSLTHIEPEPPDTWERIEEDAGKTYFDYWGCKGTCTECPSLIGGEMPHDREGTVNCNKAMIFDLVRRAKALAGVE